jgi:hypothetical protein
MSAKKPTKAERAAKRRAKERQAAKHTQEPLTPLQVWAVSLAEMLKELEIAIGDKDKARWVLSDLMRLPDWTYINPDHSPFEDDTEEDDD